LICIPLDNWAVLTIDGLEPMSEKCKMIGELYATIIRGIIDEHMKAVILKQQSEYYGEEEAG
jgi:hypothetical protein